MENFYIDKATDVFYGCEMSNQTRETRLIRIKTATLEKLAEYLDRSGSSIAHIATEALEDWIEQEMPKRLKVMEK